MNFVRGARLLAAGCALAGPTVRLGAADDWLKVQTPDVLVYSDASRRDVTEFVVNYAAFRAVFNELLAPPGHRAPPALVIFFRRVDRFRRLVQSAHHPVENLSEVSGQVGSTSLLALSVDGDRDRAMELAFEFDTSAMLPRVGYFLPVWMTQGTGEVFASLQLRGDQCEFGDSESRFTGTLEKETLIPWDTFFAISNTSTEYKGKKDHFTGIYQAQSWGVMNAVLLGGGSPRRRFAALAAKVNGTAGDAQAVADVLGVSADRLTREFWHDKSRTDPVKLPFDAAAIRAGLRIAPASDPEVKVRLAELLDATGHADEAAQELDRAELMAPGAVYVKEARGYQALRRGDTYQASLAFRDAIAAGSTDGQAFLVSAQERINDATHGNDRAGQGGPDVVQAIGEIQRCLQLAPGQEGAYRLLARAYFLAPTVSAADLAVLEPALADPNDGLVLRYYRALIYSRLDRTDEGVADIRRVLADPRVTPGLQEESMNSLRHILYETDRREVEKLIGAGKFAEAREIVARASRRADGSTDVEAYDRLKSRIGDFEVRDHALALYRQKKWKELGDLADDYLEKNPEGGFANSARQLRAMAQERLAPAPVLSSEPADSGSSAPTVSFIINRHWNGFNRYLFAMGDQMREAWTKAAPDGLSIPAGAKVKVYLYQSSDGRIAQILHSSATPGVPDAVTKACVTAVKGGAPYDKWNDSMVIEMGEKQYLVACFNF